MMECRRIVPIRVQHNQHLSALQHWCFFNVVEFRSARFDVSYRPIRDAFGEEIKTSEGMSGHIQWVRIDLASNAVGRSCRSLIQALANIRLSVIAIAKMRASNVLAFRIRMASGWRGMMEAAGNASGIFKRDANSD